MTSLTKQAKLIPLYVAVTPFVTLRKRHCAGHMTDTDRSPFVYINGEKYPLMEDYRLPVSQHFAEGTVILDPGYMPPMRLALSTGQDDLGVTLRKLLPHSHYQAYFEDPVTGVLYPPTSPACAYLTNLPPHTTAEMIGRFFESFDMVREADVCHGRSVHCDERGWVVLKDPTHLHHFARSSALEFFPGYFVHVALSEREPPKRRLFPPLTPLPAPAASAAWEPSIGGPACREAPRLSTNTNLPQPRSSTVSGGFNRPRPGGDTRNGYDKAVLDVPIPKSASPSPHLYNGRVGIYFTAFLPDEEINLAVKTKAFWPPPGVMDDIYTAASRSGGPVYLLFVAQHTFFGYARLLPQNGSMHAASGCPIEWGRHHLGLREHELRAVGGHILLKLREGVIVKPEVGAALCDLADAEPPTAAPKVSVDAEPSSVQIPAPRGGRGAAVNRGRGAVPITAPIVLPAPPAARGRTTRPAPPQPLGDGLAIPIPASRR